MSKRFHFSPLVPRAFCTGFTLLELLVSSAILAIVMILLIGMADHATRIWHDGERRRNAARELRSGLEMLTEDLHSAVITTNPSTLLITNDPKGNASSRLFFLVSHPGEKRSAGNEGDLCATGYFIAEDPSGKGVANLYRFHASGNSVAKAIEKNRLGELYNSADTPSSLSVELLARHIAKLDVRGSKNDPVPGLLLMISLQAQGDEKSPKNTDPPPEEQPLRYSTIIRLPPRRNLQPGS